MIPMRNAVRSSTTTKRTLFSDLFVAPVRFDEANFNLCINSIPPSLILGLILPSGEINWNCPCLGGMASGPCGTEFKDAFSCFHYSKEEVKGSDCLENFRAMQECMQRYPELYPQEDEKEQQQQQSSETKPTSQDSAETSGANSSATKEDSDTTKPNTDDSVES